MTNLAASPIWTTPHAHAYPITFGLPVKSVKSVKSVKPASTSAST
ncbi:hypothetical protein [Pseudomonas sp. BF-B-27]|nr:hypothetical protein [Pseudomonas sp. BF-B-27]